MDREAAFRAWIDSVSVAAPPPVAEAHDGEPVGRYRTLWISDVHLGTPGCQAAALLDFLRSTESQTLFLVGDIVDGWQLRRHWFWPQTHNDIVQKATTSAASRLPKTGCT